jgi:hypothetical protein
VHVVPRLRQQFAENLAHGVIVFHHKH